METTDWYSITDSEIIIEIGKRLKTQRIFENITQQMLAEQTGLNRSTIRDIENGRSVNLLSLIPVIRRLELLDRLDEAIPDYEKSPVLAINRRSRQRVKLSKKN
jgi:transcriptional regulator with XRE-family HTH domain